MIDTPELWPELDALINDAADHAARVIARRAGRDAPKARASPTTVRIVVDLPDPFGPTNP